MPFSWQPTKDADCPDGLVALLDAGRRYDQGGLTDGEFFNAFFFHLCGSPGICVQAACQELPPSILAILRVRVADLGTNGYRFTPTTSADMWQLNNDQFIRDAEDMRPEVQRVCDEVERFLQQHPD